MQKRPCYLLIIYSLLIKKMYIYSWTEILLVQHKFLSYPFSVEIFRLHWILLSVYMCMCVVNQLKRLLVLQRKDDLLLSTCYELLTNGERDIAWHAITACEM